MHLQHKNPRKKKKKKGEKSLLEQTQVLRHLWPKYAVPERAGPADSTIHVWQSRCDIFSPEFSYVFFLQPKKKKTSK